MNKRFTFKTIGLLQFFIFASIFSKDVLELSLESAVDIAMQNSYRIQQLKLDIDRRTYWLKATQAGLKSSLTLNLETPDLERMTDFKWDSQLQKNILVKENTNRWQGDLALQQPLILFGYPTNGYISLNYQLYRYTQIYEEAHNTDFYNRLYLKFVQPFFVPNRLKNNLEEAELNLEDSQLSYISGVVHILEDVADDYFDVFKLAYINRIYQNQLQTLRQVMGVVRQNEPSGEGQNMDRIQLELETANVRENLLENKSRYRREIANIKQKLRLDPEDSLHVLPEVHLNDVNVNLDQAIEFGFQLNPHIRRANISKRKSEIDVEYQKGRNAFRANLEITYGLERQNDELETIWEKFDNSNSVTLNAYIPILDWGERKYRINAEELDVKRKVLNIEELQENLRKNIINSFTNMQEYFTRANNMNKSTQMAAEITALSLKQYERQELSVQDILQIISRHKDTEVKFIDAFLGYQRALMDLKVTTYYDYENNLSLIQKFNLARDEGRKSSSD